MKIVNCHTCIHVDRSLIEAEFDRCLKEGKYCSVVASSCRKHQLINKSDIRSIVKRISLVQFISIKYLTI